MSLNNTERLSRIHNTLSQLFKYVRINSVLIPSFGTNWAFVIYSEEIELNIDSIDQIEKAIARYRLKDFKYYEPSTHIQSFIIPKFIIEELKKDKNYITNDNLYYDKC
ncbi:hypothetical protein JCM12294_49020 [Desulfocicer niacini]